MIEYEYKGYLYFQEKDYEEDNIKIFHTVVKGGHYLSFDWSPYCTPSFEDFAAWIDLGMPDRIGRGPLDRNDLIKLATERK